MLRARVRERDECFGGGTRRRHVVAFFAFPLVAIASANTGTPLPETILGTNGSAGIVELANLIAKYMTKHK